MKRILTLVLALLVSGVAHAQTMNNAKITATMGDQNASNLYRVKTIGESSTGTNYGWLKFNPDTGIVYPYLAYTVANTADQLITYESGTVIVDYGGVAVTTSAPSTLGYGSLHRLPPCSSNDSSLGNTYIITAGSKSTITVDPFGTDVFLKSISGTGLSAGDKLVSTGQAGDSLTVTCVGNAVWSVQGEIGLWTDAN